MKTKSKQRVPTEFGPDIEFDLAPVPEAQALSCLRLRFQELHDRLVQDLVQEVQNPALRSNLQQAASEAASLAWTTAYPLLVIPILLDEKARSARLRTVRQGQIQTRSQEIVEALL
jgi:hypothetical protein